MTEKTIPILPCHAIQPVIDFYICGCWCCGGTSLSGSATMPWPRGC
ncbi:hypothetical protein [Streptomyces sp. SCSIO 30461]